MLKVLHIDKKWCEIYPEVNNASFRCKGLSVENKVMGWLAAK